MSNLLPEFCRKVVPVKGNVIAIKPSEPYASQPLDHSYGVQWGEDFDYLIQRPKDGRPLIFGGGDLAHSKGLLGPIGDSDDTISTPPILRALHKFPRTHFADWRSGDDTIRYAWSGIMGFTPDELPFVGEVPGRPKQWVAAGYNGHGQFYDVEDYICAKSNFPPNKYPFVMGHPPKWDKR